VDDTFKQSMGLDGLRCEYNKSKGEIDGLICKFNMGRNIAGNIRGDRIWIPMDKNNSVSVIATKLWFFPGTVAMERGYGYSRCSIYTKQGLRIRNMFIKGGSRG
jgi:hypothetical protein